MKKIKFNLNCFVKVKLTDYGKDIYYHQYDESNKIIPTKYKIKPQMPEIDKKGYYKTLLWQLMELYGLGLLEGPIFLGESDPVKHAGRAVLEVLHD